MQKQRENSLAGTERNNWELNRGDLAKNVMQQKQFTQQPCLLSLPVEKKSTLFGSCLIRIMNVKETTKAANKDGKVMHPTNFTHI
jgi:hypothetical protein